MKELYTVSKNLIIRGRVIKSLPDDKSIPLTLITFMGQQQLVMPLFPYGMSANLPEDTEVIAISVNLDESNRICIGYSLNDRFRNESGEVTFGNPKTESKIKFDKNGKIAIESKSNLEISVTGDVNLTVSGNVNIDASQVNLGSGGNEIARKGDNIVVNVGGSDYTGTITTGGTNTSI